MRKWSRNSLFATVVIMGFVCLSSCDTGYGPTMWDSPQPPSRPQVRLSIPDTMLADNAGKLTTLYCLAGSNCQQVPSFVRENRDAFQDTQQLYRCTERFVNAVLQAVISAPSRSEIEESVYRVAGSNPDLLPHAPDIVEQQQNDLADLVVMARYMQQLAEAVPSMLQSNDRPYYDMEMIQIMIIADPYMLNEYRAFIFNCSYPLIYPMVKMACN